MSALKEFEKASPSWIQLHDEPTPGQAYKYFIHGKGCTLGVLFEDSVNIYFEWLRENDEPVTHPKHIRYRAWPKREFTRLLMQGVWELAGAEWHAGVSNQEERAVS